jgi:hypothetical protein
MHSDKLLLGENLDVQQTARLNCSAGSLFVRVYLCTDVCRTLTYNLKLWFHVGVLGVAQLLAGRVDAFRPISTLTTAYDETYGGK